MQSFTIFIVSGTMSTKKQSKITFSKLSAKEETTLTTSTDSESVRSADCPSDTCSPAMRPEPSSSLSLSTATMETTPSQPFQPKSFAFPRRFIGNRERSFVGSWFDKFPWLHYSVEKDAALCFTCMEAKRTKAISQTKGEDAFTDVGYRNWKKAITKDGFAAHEASDAHQEAVLRCIKAPSASYGKAATMMSGGYQKSVLTNQRMLLKIFSNVRYLARQSIPLRGNWNKEDRQETNSNFMQLIHLRAEDDVELVRWLKRKHYKYTSPQIQNEMLDSLALGIFQDIASSIQTADISNREQLVICIRWVDEELVVHEDFIGLRPVAETNASTITDTIKSILVEMNLDIMNARGQCYDGASTMRGHRTGVVPAIKSINGKCLYTHCYDHALNLAVSDAIKGVKVLSDAFDTVKEICKLVEKSPQRDTHLKFVKTSRENEAKSVLHCPNGEGLLQKNLFSSLRPFHRIDYGKI